MSTVQVDTPAVTKGTYRKPLKSVPPNFYYLASDLRKVLIVVLDRIEPLKRFRTPTAAFGGTVIFDILAYLATH